MLHYDFAGAKRACYRYLVTPLYEALFGLVSSEPVEHLTRQALASDKERCMQCAAA